MRVGIATNKIDQPIRKSPKKMLSRQECVAISQPATAMEQADSGVEHEVTVPLNEGPAPEAWAGLQRPDQPRPLDALHNMLREASVMSSHLRAYKPAVEAYASAASKFFDAMHDFLASSGACMASLSFL